MWRVSDLATQDGQKRGDDCAPVKDNRLHVRLARLPMNAARPPVARGRPGPEVIEVAAKFFRTGQYRAAASAYAGLLASGVVLSPADVSACVDSLVMLGQAEQAIEILNRIAASAPAHWLQIRMAECRSAQGRFEDALGHYAQAWRDGCRHGAESTLLAFMELARRDRRREDMRWMREQMLLSRALFNPRLGIVYQPIPKNACTLFKTEMLRHSDEWSQFVTSQTSLHAFIWHQASSLKVRDIVAWSDPRWLRLVILRNPFHRLVSAYIDKFVKWGGQHVEPFILPIIRHVQRCRPGEEDLDRGVSFREFVHYVCARPDFALDEHWRSQASFLGGAFGGAAGGIDHAGRFEDLRATFTLIEQRSDIRITENVDALLPNDTPKMTNWAAASNASSEHYCDWTPSALRTLGAYPRPYEFYPDGLILLVRERYWSDIRLYQSASGHEPLPHGEICSGRFSRKILHQHWNRPLRYPS